MLIGFTRAGLKGHGPAYENSIYPRGIYLEICCHGKRQKYFGFYSKDTGFYQ